MEKCARPLPYIEPLNILSDDMIKGIELEVREKVRTDVIYITEERERMIVESAVEIAEKIKDDAKRSKDKNIKFNIGIDGTMFIGKSTLLRHLHMLLPILYKEVVFITVTAYNMLCYNIMYNGLIKDENGEIVEKIDYQKHFKGNDGEQPDYNNLNKDAVITNLNNLHKTIELLESLGKEYIIFYDECHTIISDYNYRNSKTSNDEEAYDRVLDRFKRNLDFCLTRESKCKGIIWCSATMDVFSYNPLFEFTKIYDLDLKDEYKIPIGIIKPVHLKGDSILSKVLFMINWLKLNPEEAVLSIYRNNVRETNKIIELFKKYVLARRTDLTEEYLDSIIGVVNADNTEDNNALNSIQKNSVLPDNIRILFTTSYMNAGVEVNVKGRALDFMMFIDKKSFSLLPEIQSTGRYRCGIRSLYLIASDLKYRKMIDYAQYVDIKYKEFEKLAKDTINYLEGYAKIAECSLLTAKEAVFKEDKGNLALPQNHITYRDGNLVVNELAVRNAIFVLYQQHYTLSSFDSLVNAFYNHKTINAKHIAKLKTVDYSDITLESLGLEKPKKTKSKGVSKSQTTKVINRINELMNDENRDYISSAILNNNLSYLDYSIEEIDEYGETSLTFVNNEELKNEIAILLKSNRYSVAKNLISKSKTKNKKLINDILDTKISIKKFRERINDNIASNIITRIEEAPLMEQEKEEKKIKKIDQKNGAFIIEAKKAIDLVVTDENPNSLNITLNMKKAVFEYLMYTEIPEQFGIEVKWTIDGNPTPYDKNNKAHNKLINKVFKTFFNLDKRGRISSRKKL